MQIVAARKALAAALEGAEQWTEAARVLAALPLDSAHRHVGTAMTSCDADRPVPADERIGVHLHVAALYLEAGDAVLAETHVNRAAASMRDTRDPLLIMQFKVRRPPAVEMHAFQRRRPVMLAQVHQARILDSKRKARRL